MKFSLMMDNKTGTSLYLLPFESCSVAVETLKVRDLRLIVTVAHICNHA